MGSARRNAKAKSQPQLRSRNTRSSRGRLLTSTDPAHSTALLNSQLRSLGLYAADTLGDGNCLFRALSDQLYGSPSKHMELRLQICDWIEKHRQRYEPFVEDERGLAVHLKCMRENGTYGGHMELSAFAHLTKRNVKVIQPGLVYVIEWAAFFSTGDDDDEESEVEEMLQSDDVDDHDLPKSRRDRIRDAKGKAAAKGKARSKGKRVLVVDVVEQHDEENDQTLVDGTIYVAYHDWEHFSSIRNLRGPHTGLPCVCETPPPPTATLETLSPKGKNKLKPATTTTKVKARKVTLKLGSELSSAAMGTEYKKDSAQMDVDADAIETSALDPTTIPLPASGPSSRSASPFPPSSSTPSAASSPAPSSSYVPIHTHSHPTLPLPHPLRNSHLPSEEDSVTDTRSLSVPTAPPSSSSSASSAAVSTSAPLPRTNRSPKRTLDESGCESEASNATGGKRSRTRAGSSTDTTSQLLESVGIEVSISISSAGSTMDVDADADVDASSASSSPLSSSALSSEAEEGDESPASSPEPESGALGAKLGRTSASANLPPPDASATGDRRLTRAQRRKLGLPDPPSIAALSKAAEAEAQGPRGRAAEKPLTRRQRKKLGLPKPRPAYALRSGTAARGGKIVIPGGKFGHRGPGDDNVAQGDEGEEEEDDGENERVGEWVRNGNGRVDVRGFRELRI